VIRDHFYPSLQVGARVSVCTRVPGNLSPSFIRFSTRTVTAAGCARRGNSACSDRRDKGMCAVSPDIIDTRALYEIHNLGAVTMCLTYLLHFVTAIKSETVLPALDWTKTITWTVFTSPTYAVRSISGFLKRAKRLRRPTSISSSP